MEIHKKKCVCGHMLDTEDIYQQGKADEREKCETCIHKVTKADIDAIEENARADERAKCKCPYWNEEHRECATSFEEDIRADEREKVLEELENKIACEYYDGGYGDYHEVEMIVRMIHRLKGQKND